MITGRPRAICGQLYPLPCFGVRNRAVASKGTKFCRTQGDFCLCLKKGMRCYRGLIKGLQEPKLRSKKADVWPENANRKLKRADLRLESAGLGLERSED